jgi:hypothetical protein
VSIGHPRLLGYLMMTGRNVDEVLRVIDSLQLTADEGSDAFKWKNGDDLIIFSSVSDDEVRHSYLQGSKAPKSCLRIVPQRRANARGRLSAGCRAQILGSCATITMFS